jgi:hypothetical protein
MTLLANSGAAKYRVPYSEFPLRGVNVPAGGAAYGAFVDLRASSEQNVMHHHGMRFAKASRMLLAGADCNYKCRE